jgi:hypothetical protein
LYVEDEYFQIYQIAYLKLNNIEFTEDNLEEKFKEYSFFEIISGKGAGGVAGLLRSKSPELFKDKKIVGLFDFDKEGRENFHHLKDSFWKGDTQGSKKEGFYKKRHDCDDIYALLLPISERLDKYASLEWENFVSYVEIENLLSENIIRNESSFFEKKEMPGKSIYYKCKGGKAKKKFWKEIIKYSKENFIDFEPIFNFINLKLGE